jgi:MFS transporter, DHA2 family, multidrug resistance protein
MSALAEPQRATRRDWLGLAIIALPCLLYSMDLTVLNLALPSLSRTLAPSASELLWILDIYGFLVAGLLISMGNLGDRIGRRRLLLLGAGAFGVASVLAAFSTSALALIGARAALGVAGATLAPSTLSLIRNMFHHPEERTFAIGVWVTSYSVGAALGPLLGGLLLSHFWWGSVFLIGTPVMGLLLVLGPFVLPEYRSDGDEPLDPASAALSLGSVLGVIYGLKAVAQDGWSWLAAMSISLGLALGVAFVHRQRRLVRPWLDLRLFRTPALRAALLTYMLGTFAAFGGFVFISQHLQLVLALSPLAAGLATLPWALGFVVGSLAVPRLVRRARPAAVVSGGLVVAASGFGLLARVDTDSTIALVVTASSAIALGLAPVFTLATDLIVGAAPPERAGAASALSETSSELGGALGIAILGSLGAALYSNGMSGGVPEELAVEAARTAQTTLGAALSLADHLPGRLGLQLARSAREAFTAALRVGAAASAVLLVGAAWLSFGPLERTREAAGSDASPSRRGPPSVARRDEATLPHSG